MDKMRFDLFYGSLALVLPIELGVVNHLEPSLIS